MTVDFSGVNNAVVFAFAEDCIIRTNAGDHIVKAVFSAPYEGMSMRGVQIDRQDTAISVKTSDISGISLNRRDIATIRGNGYSVVSIADDEAGMTEIVIARNP